jgi:hypothetical protein
MQNTLQPGYNFSLAESVLQKRFIMIIHALSLLCVWAAKLEVYFQLLISSGLFFSYLTQNRATRTGQYQLRYASASGWTISFNNSDFSPIKIKSETTISQLLTILCFRNGVQNQSLAIFNDALPASEYRKLTVLLKISSPDCLR